MAVKKKTTKAAKKVIKKTVKKAVKKAPAKAAKKQVSKKITVKKSVTKSGSSVTVQKTVTLTPAPQATGPGMDKMSCEVINKEGKSFVIVVNRARNFFDLEEMRAMVNICHSAEGEFDGAQRLFSWLKNRRRDVLIDTEISMPSDQSLRTIYKYLINNYSVKRD